MMLNSVFAMLAGRSVAQTKGMAVYNAEEKGGR